MLIGPTLEHYLASEELEELELQISIFDEDNPSNANSVELVGEQCRAMFKDSESSLVVSGYETVSVTYLGGITLDEDEGKEKIWQRVERFEIILRSTS